MSSNRIPGTGLSAITPEPGTRRVSYQLPNAKIQQKILSEEQTQTVNLNAGALPLTPLATVNWDSGHEVRVYYLDSNYAIQERRIIGGVETPGDIYKVGARAAPSAGLAATVHNHDGQIKIRVFYQELETFQIKELIRDGGNAWRYGALLIKGVLANTIIAAVTYRTHNQTKNVVFYQTVDLSLKDHVYENGQWGEGSFNPGQAAGWTPLGAVHYGVGNINFQVYWRNLDNEVVFAKYTGEWEAPEPIPGIGAGYKHAVLQWNNGKKLKFYYQKFDGVISEHLSNDGGATWKQGVEPI